MNKSRTIIFCLGRYGDIINVLPLAWSMAQRGEKPIFCAAQEFASILDGVSYVERIIYPGLYNDPPAALRWLKTNHPKDRIIIAQSYRHPSDRQHLTDSYQKESWRVAGALDEFGKHPLVFDQRNQAREDAFASEVLAGKVAPILVATGSVSSPFPAGPRLLENLRNAFPDNQVVDISAIRAERIYDLLALYDRAACLVSVDSVHLHLARAAKCPVVAMCNDHWFGSCPPPATRCYLRYSDFKTAAGDDTVIHAIMATLGSAVVRRFVVHAVDMHGASERHLRAQATWEAAYGDEDVIDCRLQAADFTLTAKHFGDERDLPIFVQLLEKAVECAHDDRDVVIWSTSDCGFTAGAFRQMKEHAALYGAFSMRRSAGHIGREVFGFTVGWIKLHLHLIPEFFCGAPAFDLVMAALIRKDRRVVTTKENLMVDFFPCEMAPGLAIHEDHPSSWAGENEHKYPANLINLSLARRWASENAMAPIV